MNRKNDRYVRVKFENMTFILRQILETFPRKWLGIFLIRSIS